jgi:hypothetical protein
MIIMVTNIYEHRLVVLFIEGLAKPLRGWVKAFRSPTLQDAIMKSWDMVDIATKKALVKPFIP